ncbi:MULTISPECIES: 3-oxoacyl-ACP synthase [Geobacter]|uniref:3-oxoacyl-ACP synthase n=2 Tax=Geobacter TaxID=28231 RepID=A0A0C1TRT5_9BACT|nr:MULTISPECIES: 3-oxoacyl-ACP synthase [Geobacter]KIE43494.1 3-oxoacyl-ACP synthase [Geobacter soli]MBE2888764.1 3-oxoacyl-ACP synthase [Geobacter anodireducens]
MRTLAITGASCVTAVGHDGPPTAASVRAGISRFAEYDDYRDENDNPITVARIRGIHDSWDTPQRMAGVAALCLEKLLDEYFRQDPRRPSQIHLFLGVASEERPGPRYEESSLFPLRGIIGKWTDKPGLQAIPRGNASMMYSLEQASRLINSNPDAVCIVGGVDSLLRTSTLNWFEKDCRLKSASYGRHQGLIAGEAVGFMVIENRAGAKQSGKPILGSIAGLGLAVEPAPRASSSLGRNSGLTEACHAALSGVQEKAIRAVFSDLNGENSRAREWGMAEMRCFDKLDESRRLWTPANCYGDIGAASGVVLASIAMQGLVRGWLQSPILVTCSDDHGPCGALVLESEK